MRAIGMALAMCFVSAVAAPAVDERTATRVFVGETAAGEVAGGGGPDSGMAVRFGKRCPEVTVTLNKEKADYVVLLEQEAVETPFQRGNKFAIFGGNGDMVAAGSTRTLKNAVKDACEVIQKRLAGEN